MSEDRRLPEASGDRVSVQPVQQVFDRAALERVLARAAELQARSADTPEGLSDAELVELGKEVGIAAEHIRQAIAEERSRVPVPEERGLVASWFGPSLVTAGRVVSGNPAQVLALLDSWMQREELLRVRRRFADRLVWEARRDFLGALQAGLNLRGRSYALTRAAEVGATVTAVDEERVVVRLHASFAPSRRRSAVAAGVVAGVAFASSAGLVAVAGSVADASGVIVGGIVGTVLAGSGAAVAAAIGATQRKRAQKGQLALEQILDRLEHGEIKPGRPSLADLLVPGR
ncbi:MAG TPA: hypothetical protein VNL96_09745 [Gemmatimonadaceae bacterium]|nr:hypothetical protein [Gemmatimonadaceae bacterium]